MMAWRDWLAAGYADAAAGVAALGVPALAGVAAAGVPVPLLDRAPPPAAAGCAGACAAAAPPPGVVPVGCTMVRSSAAIGATSVNSPARRSRRKHAP